MATKMFLSLLAGVALAVLIIFVLWPYAVIPAGNIISEQWHRWWDKPKVALVSAPTITPPATQPTAEDLEIQHLRAENDRLRSEKKEPREPVAINVGLSRQIVTSAVKDLLPDILRQNPSLIAPAAPAVISPPLVADTATTLPTPTPAATANVVTSSAQVPTNDLDLDPGEELLPKPPNHWTVTFESGVAEIPQQEQ